MGNMRDEAAKLDLFPNTTDVALAIEYAGYNSTIYLDNPELFPLPAGSNATLNVFDVTTQFGTDAMLRCIDQAIAYSGANRNVFKSVWYYEFDRSYQSAGYDFALCDAPKDAQHPYGDTSQPYFR